MTHNFISASCSWVGLLSLFVRWVCPCTMQVKRHEVVEFLEKHFWTANQQVSSQKSYFSRGWMNGWWEIVQWIERERQIDRETSGGTSLCNLSDVHAPRVDDLICSKFAGFISRVQSAALSFHWLAGDGRAWPQKYSWDVTSISCFQQRRKQQPKL